MFLVFGAAWIGLAQTPEEEKKALEEELKSLEEKISQYEKSIDSVQKERKTLQNQITILQSKIKKLNLEISRGNLMIKDIKRQIQDTENSIQKTTDELDKTRVKLKGSLRTLYQENQKGNAEILLSSEQLSDFFTNLANLEALNLRVTQSLEDVKSLKISLEDEKDSLDKEKEDLQKVVGLQILQKQAGEDNKKQQESILEITKGKETVYQKYLEESKKRAAEIRSRIFELIGVPQAPTFGQAYEIAKIISKTTGVRPALLLAVIKQESNLGKNVGQCFLKDPKKGSGVRITTGAAVTNVMKPSRDVQPFLQITQELGRDPYNTSVSCPIPSVGGYGGAMGPAQFIPSTWMIYRDELKELSGRAADPWNVSDAFLAAALYLKDFGAASQKENDEWRAAMIYFSGSTNSKYRFYGDSVISLARGLEEDIKAIENGQ
ncbi:MAG: lytic murein transglycosylase [Candidatus Nealsonbacteria bacterium]|nr:lytic murein transglycosylase [Candidatus Nealsonbacteria bacterium]